MREKIFNNESDHTFAESTCEFCINSSSIEISLLVLDKGICWSRSPFNDVNDWIDCKGKLKHYHEKFCAQSKARDRKKMIVADSNNNSD